MTTLNDKISSLKITLDCYKTNYATEKAKFIAEVDTNPANAVQWASTLMTAQGLYETAMQVVAVIAWGIDSDDRVVEIVKGHVFVLERRIRRSHGTSTSGYSNAVEYDKHMATIQVLEQLEGWLEYVKKP